MVTGAAGFVGANLVAHLSRNGCEVHILVKPDSNLWRIESCVSEVAVHEVDLADGPDVRKIVGTERPEIVFHLATSYAHPRLPGEREKTIQTDVLGTLHLLDALESLDLERFVHIGSSLEYGHRSRPLQEEDRLEPSTFRGVAKASAALLCQQCARARQWPLVILRLFSVYGPWEEPGRLIPTAIMAARSDGEIDLTVSGVRHDFIYIEDVVNACLVAVLRPLPPGEIINIGSGRQWTNYEVVQMIQDISGRSIKVGSGVFPSRHSDTRHWVADIGKARQLLDWEPQHTLEQGLKKTISWFDLHQEAYSARAIPAGQAH